MLYQLFMYGLILVSCVVVLHPGINDNLVQRIGLSILPFGALIEANGSNPNGHLLLAIGAAVLALGSVFKLFPSELQSDT